MSKRFRIYFLASGILCIISVSFADYYFFKQKRVLDAKLITIKTRLLKEQQKHQSLIETIDSNGNRYIKKLSYSDFELLRQEFLTRIDTEDKALSNRYSNEQLSIIKDALNSWEDFKTDNRIHWWLKGYSNIESLFIYYSKDDPVLKATWATVLDNQNYDDFGDLSKFRGPNMITAAATLTNYYKLKGVEDKAIPELVGADTKHWLSELCACKNQ